MTVPQVFDSLIAKLIVTGASRAQALQRAARALAEFEVGGMPTVLPFHRAVVAIPRSPASRCGCTPGGSRPSSPTPCRPGARRGRRPPERERSRSRSAASGSRSWCPPTGGGRADPAASSGPERRGASRGSRPFASGAAMPWQPDAGHDREDRRGRRAAGRRRVIVVLEAMKMEQPLTAHKDGKVSGLGVTVGQTVTAARPSARSRSDPGAGSRGSEPAGSAVRARRPAAGRNREWVRHELTDAGWRAG